MIMSLAVSFAVGIIIINALIAIMEISAGCGADKVLR